MRRRQARAVRRRALHRRPVRWLCRRRRGYSRAGSAGPARRHRPSAARRRQLLVCDTARSAVRWRQLPPGAQQQRLRHGHAAQGCHNRHSPHSDRRRMHGPIRRLCGRPVCRALHRPRRGVLRWRGSRRHRRRNLVEVRTVAARPGRPGAPLGRRHPPFLHTLYCRARLEAWTWTRSGRLARRLVRLAEPRSVPRSRGLRGVCVGCLCSAVASAASGYGSPRNWIHFACTHVRTENCACARASRATR
mmetsp:Transcript_9127/g.30319  ORF Transcript_9127/g.30319 Transcript_9127/m.30319 type:complete len:247 (-) Transcript_9127:1096-1836(-)